MPFRSREWYKRGTLSLWQGKGIKKTSHSQFSTVHSHETSSLAGTWEGGEAFPATSVVALCSPEWAPEGLTAGDERRAGDLPSSRWPTSTYF